METKNKTLTDFGIMLSDLNSSAEKKVNAVRLACIVTDNLCGCTLRYLVSR